jgi:LPS-assembly protein
LRAWRRPLTDRRLIGWLATSALAAGAGGPSFAAELDDAISVSSAPSKAPPPMDISVEASIVYPDPTPTGETTIIAAAAPEQAARSARLSDALLAQTLADRSSDNAILAALTPAQAGPEATPPPAADERVLFEADEVTRDTENSPIVATGKVRAYSGDRYLEADRLSYDPATDIVVAEGNVSITDKVGGAQQTVFAGRVELTGDLRDGVAEHFSALLAEGTRIAGDRGVREQGARTKLTKAVYSACDVCEKDGDGKAPTWRVKALRVTRDEERKVVRFKHAFFELKGVPILYAPYLQAADPSVERMSGFLTPFIGTSSRLGFNLELPYYFAFSNHTDATFSPKYTSRDGILWQGEWRQRGRHGGHVVQAGVINIDPTKPDPDGNPLVDVPGVRWHFFGAGSRSFGEKWRLGYDIERVSDDTYFRQYDVDRRGDLRQEIDTVSTLRLRSNANLRWRSGGSELRADAYLFQGLRSTDVSELTPYVMPLINFRHDFANDIAGGRLHLNANFAALQRTGGADSRRLTGNVTWEREIVTPGGHKFELLADLRGDIYRFADLNEGTEILAPDPARDSREVLRFAPTVAAQWSYPLTRRFAGAQILIEPRAQLAASPSNRNPVSILNEDSQSVEFDYQGLFEYDKSPGFDRFEDGQRLNAGLTAAAAFDNGMSIDASAGAQWRLQSTDAFNPASGLGTKRSDIVGELNFRYKTNVIFENRFRFDDKTLDLSRAESTLLLSAWRFTGVGTYVRLNEENRPAELLRREEINGNLRFMVTKNWAISSGWRRDLARQQSITQDIGVTYTDECSSLSVIYIRDLTRDVGLPADNRLLLRFTLRGLVN